MEKTVHEIDERNKRLGRQLQKYRKEANVTQEEMSKFCGVSKNHLSKIEGGVYKCPANVMIDYGRRLNVSLNTIAEFDPQSSATTQCIANIMPELQYKIANLSKKNQKTLLVVLQALENQQ